MSFLEAVTLLDSKEGSYALRDDQNVESLRGILTALRGDQSLSSIGMLNVPMVKRSMDYTFDLRIGKY